MYGIKNKPIAAGWPAGVVGTQRWLTKLGVDFRLADKYIRSGWPESCTSIKAKRLFMHTAEQLNHAWVFLLDLSRVDFGSRKRTIHTGGRLYTKYSLVVADTSGGQEALTRLREVLGL